MLHYSLRDEVEFPLIILYALQIMDVYTSDLLTIHDVTYRFVIGSDLLPNLYPLSPDLVQLLEVRVIFL